MFINSIGQTLKDLGLWQLVRSLQFNLECNFFKSIETNPIYKDKDSIYWKYSHLRKPIPGSSELDHFRLSTFILIHDAIMAQGKLQIRQLPKVSKVLPSLEN